MVTPPGLLIPPTETDIGRVPDEELTGICTFNGIKRATSPGASPANWIDAGRPPMSTGTGCKGGGM